MPIKIKFTDTTNNIAERYYPIPAIKNLPVWFKELQPQIITVEQNRGNNKTAKKCVPLMDCTSAGYLLLTPVDIYVSQENGGLQYHWPHEPGVEFQATWQVGKYKNITEKYHAIPKFPNPWAVKTPRGYSCLYTTPMNRDDLPFEIFSAIVDTDKYNQAGSIPFYFKDDNFKGLIPAGTPMAQVIPFKRDVFFMTIGSVKDQNFSNKQFNELRSVFDGAYRKMYWSKKIFK